MLTNEGRSEAESLGGVDALAAALAETLRAARVGQWTAPAVATLLDRFARRLGVGLAADGLPAVEDTGAFAAALAEVLAGDSRDVPPALIDQLAALSDRRGPQFVEDLLAAIDRVVRHTKLALSDPRTVTLAREWSLRPNADPSHPTVGGRGAGTPPCETSERFSWLFAAHVEVPAEDVTADDWARAARVARSAPQVIALTGPRLLRWAGSKLGGTALGERIVDEIIAARACSALQMEQLRDLHRVLTAAGIPYVVLKGAAVREFAYPDPLLRSAEDIDLGVSKSAARATEEALVAAGFELAEWDPIARAYRRANMVRRRLVERDHYELGAIVRRVVVAGLDDPVDRTLRRSTRETGATWHVLADGRLACYVILDVHHGITGRITTAPILDTRVDRAGLPLPSIAWCLFHAVSKIYWEGIKTYRTGLHQYADLLALLRVSTDPDVEALLALVEAHDLTIGAYYVLRRLESAFHWPASATVTRFLAAHTDADEGRSPLRMNDYGDMWPKLWGYR
jgi:hypothetical protein